MGKPTAAYTDEECSKSTEVKERKLQERDDKQNNQINYKLKIIYETSSIQLLVRPYW